MITDINIFLVALETNLRLIDSELFPNYENIYYDVFGDPQVDIKSGKT